MKYGRLSIGDRMKKYENISRVKLIPKVPVIIRVDGKAFHTFTKEFKRPFDQNLIDLMDATAIKLCELISGAKMAYVQSDEISILLTDYDNIKTQGWFDYNLQKLASVSASIATAEFNKHYYNYKMRPVEGSSHCGSYFVSNKYAMFDARAFNIPHHEVVNYFIWRQQDWTRNSIQMLARSYFSHKECHGLDSNQLQDKLFKDENVNWNDLPIALKRGRCIKKKKMTIYRKAANETKCTPETFERTRWVVKIDPPIFTQNRDYIRSMFMLTTENES